jgi:dTDP-4-amino-4,6-dideoxygalactose transaminase
VEDLKVGGSVANRWLPQGITSGQGQLKSLLAVDVYGQPAEYDQLRVIADQHDLILIQDSCESLGSMYRGQPCGKQGSLAVFAFYPNKQITTAEGGMVVTDQGVWADKMRALRNQGRAPGDTWLDHTFLGYNYRMDELSAALGRAQLTRLEELITRRSQVAAWYTERIGEIPGVESILISPNTSRMSWFVYVVRFERKFDLRELILCMREAGIPSRPYFTPIHLQPYMVERFGYRVGDYPVTEDLSQRSLALPFSSVMSEGEVELVCQTLRQELATL